MSKIIFKKIIDIYFSTKSYLKNNYNHTVKQFLMVMNNKACLLKTFFEKK